MVKHRKKSVRRWVSTMGNRGMNSKVCSRATSYKQWSLFTHAHLERTQFGFCMVPGTYGYMVWVDETPWRQCSRIPAIKILQFLPVSSLMQLCWAYAQKRPSKTSINFMDGYDPNQQSRIQYMDESHPARDPWYVQKCVLKIKRRWDAFLLQHVTLVIQFTMIWHSIKINDIAFIHFIIYFMHKNGSKWYINLPCSCSRRILSHAFVRSERSAICRLLGSWKLGEIGGMRRPRVSGDRRWEVVSRCGSHYGFHIFMVYLSTFTIKNQRNVSK